MTTVNMNLTPNEAYKVLRSREEARHDVRLTSSKDDSPNAHYRSRCSCGWEGRERPLSNVGHAVAGNDGEWHVQDAVRKWSAQWVMAQETTTKEHN